MIIALSPNVFLEFRKVRNIIFPYLPFTIACPFLNLTQWSQESSSIDLATSSGTFAPSFVHGCHTETNPSSYDLPHHIYGAHVYPRRSSNGSTVIVYGHENGLRVVWYGGKRFKSSTSAARKVNGNAPDVIDLDSEDGAPVQSQPEFEEEYEEIDPAAPFHKVLRNIDIPLGSPALQLAFPPLTAELSDDTPSLIKDKIVVVVGCADYTVRTVVLPLQPPAPSATDASKIGVQIAKHTGHQDLVTAVAITYASSADGDLEDNDEEQQDSTTKWALLLASTSCSGPGMLLIHQVQIQGDKLVAVGSANKAFRRESVRAPLSSASITFNTAPHQAERHTSLLMTIPDISCVKVYQVFARDSSKRRGSAATLDSVSTSRSAYTSSIGGKFTATLLPSFHTENGSDARRKRPLDAKWISSGRAILVLLEDGQFGIWDLEAVGPPTETVLKNQGHAAGISGGGTTKLAASGFLYSLRDGPKNFNTGTVSIGPSPAGDNDEAVILSVGGVTKFIPSVATWWRSKSSGKGSLQPNDRLVTLPAIGNAVDDTKSLELLPDSSPERSGPSSDPTCSFLVATSSQLILYVSPLDGPSNPEQQSRPETAEQSLLLSGNLDLDDVDRYLDGMQRSRPQSQQTMQPRIGAKPNFGSSMMSHDGEMDLDSPMVDRVPFSLGSKAVSQNNTRRLFS